jgi:glycosyltransferase involved in cell wall biosynthesis
MKKVLYTTAQVMPYRTKFFNILANDCNLTVLYDNCKEGERNDMWIHSVNIKHKCFFLNHKYLHQVFAWLEILFWVSKKWDVRIVGCINSKIEIVAILYMRLFHIPYILNLDGETFFEGNSIKSKMKKFMVKGAKAYLGAGEKSVYNLKKVLGNVSTCIFNFSSLTENELVTHRQYPILRKDYILIVGGYLPYKGLDIALETAKLMPNIIFKFVGSGKRSNLLMLKANFMNLKNVQIVPFLQSYELFQEYKRCKLFVLPTVQECWGLVINEAASFGTPIVSTWGSGAAVEFLSDDFSQFLAKPNDAVSLKEAIVAYLRFNYKKEYADYLIEKSKDYSIEKMCRKHIQFINSII